MPNTPVPLTPKNHSALRLQPGYAHTRNARLVPISAAEALLVAREFMIVFPAKSNLPCAVLGMDSNAYVRPDGTWAADYVPAALRQGPFSIARAKVQGEEAAQAIVMVDAQSPALGSEGAPLFGTDGRAVSEVMARAQLQATQQRAMRATARMVKELDEQGLLVNRNWLTRTSDGKTTRVTGMRVIDDRKLRTLSAAALETLNRSGSLELAYAQSASAANLSVGILARAFPLQRPAPAANKAPATKKTVRR